VRLRPRVEALEVRWTMNNRFVVPLEIAADQVSTFHQLSDALFAAGLASGDVVEIKQGAEPGGISSFSVPLLANLTIRGEAAVGPQDLGVVAVDGLSVAGI